MSKKVHVSSVISTRQEVKLLRPPKFKYKTSAISSSYTTKSLVHRRLSLVGVTQHFRALCSILRGKTSKGRGLPSSVCMPTRVYRALCYLFWRGKQRAQPIRELRKYAKAAKLRERRLLMSEVFDLNYGGF